MKLLKMSAAAQPLTAVPPRLYEHEFMAMKRCRHGLFLYNVHDLFVGRSLDCYGEWCEAELQALGQLIKPGDVVLDIGANIGTHALFFATQVSDQGCVFAFEPQRLVFQTLCANLALNAVTNVIAIPQGVGNRAGIVRLPVFNPRGDRNFGAVPVLGHDHGEPVSVVRIDDLHLSGCNLVKVDVEGMECEVLEGARETIARYRPALFVENNTIERSAATIAGVESLEYEAYWHISSYFSAGNFFGNAENVFAGCRPEANLLCFHRSCRLEVQGLPKVTGVEDDWRQALTRMG